MTPLGGKSVLQESEMAGNSGRGEESGREESFVVNV